MEKIDVMNMRKGEEWIIVNGKVQRVEKNIIVADTVDKEAVEEVIKVKKEVTKKGKKHGK